MQTDAWKGCIQYPILVTLQPSFNRRLKNCQSQRSRPFLILQKFCSKKYIFYTFDFSDLLSVSIFHFISLWLLPNGSILEGVVVSDTCFIKLVGITVILIWLLLDICIWYDMYHSKGFDKRSLPMILSGIKANNFLSLNISWFFYVFWNDTSFKNLVISIPCYTKKLFFTYNVQYL